MSDDQSHLRDYGLGDSNEEMGVPEWKRVEDPEAKCPNCGGQLCEVTVRAKNKMLRGGEGTCHYLGCPACPYASPAVTVADPR
tara:strand:- start:15 stop:263 length:249 start_codon:yes stop_codon:yes gene_type:complete